MTANWIGLYILVYLSAVGVNCFVMLSGFLLANSTGYRWRSVFRTWFTVFFYSFGICLIFFCLGKATAKELIASAFPVYTDQYWFMTKFIGLSVIAPFLSRLAGALNKKDYVIMIIILSFLNLRLFKFPYGETFGGQNSLMWFIYLYLVGAYIRKYEPFKEFKHFGKSYLLFGILLAGAYMMLNVVLHHFRGDPICYAGTFYNSFTFATSLLLFMWAAYLKMDKEPILHLISSIAPCMFGIYLISEHDKLRYVIWDGIIQIRGMQDSLWLIPLILASSIAVFAVCCLIDRLRIALFKILHIQ